MYVCTYVCLKVSLSNTKRNLALCDCSCVYPHAEIWLFCRQKLFMFHTLPLTVVCMHVYMYVRTCELISVHKVVCMDVWMCACMPV